MRTLTAGQRVRLQRPSFGDTLPPEATDVWICEFMEALAGSRREVEYEEMISWLEGRSWGCLVLSEFAFLPLARLAQHVGPHLPELYRSGAVFLNEFGFQSTQLHKVCPRLRRVLESALGAVPEQFAEPLTIESFFPSRKGPEQ